MRTLLTASLLAILGTGITLQESFAGELEVTVEIPRLRVSEYHRPYVAVWIQDENNRVAANLAVWYQLKHPTDQSGTKWLPDLRQWWRRTGRGLELPIDGLSGATKPAGEHKLSFSTSDKQLADLKPGKYTLLVEASREVGGRELLEIEFTWPAQKKQNFRVSGKEELGTINLTIQP
ncbi:DUF2271 domain-containing protein [Rubinisphaera sp. JC750]|uniref:DUF2271 domain-containing protein n=1 Tax=Rubinisphaera sp. JC750 TaxID=2898658 RepID=UPI001F2215E9|nr:DUF2271 domain-containing protein [Rubinisphaera sp. JC750]